MKKLLFISLLSLAGYCSFLGALHILSDGFSLDKIKSELSYSRKWDVENPPVEEIREILSQNFHYIGKGSQCYVFESEDRDSVLKFFRHSRYRLPFFSKYITAPDFLAEIQNRKREEKEMRREHLFQSCKLAYQELKTETGLLYLHLNKSQDLQKTVFLYDRLNRKHILQIDSYEFMIQKRGEHIFPYLTHLLEKGKKEEAKEALADLVALVSRRLKKNIIDHDAVIHKNSGFRGRKALFIDVGEFTKESTPPPLHHELQRATTELREWLETRDPSLASYLDRLISSQ